MTSFCNFLVIGASLVSGQCSSSPQQIADSTTNITGSPPFPDGTVVSYRCLEGYTLSASNRFSSCTNGIWTAPNVECNKILCSRLDTPVNGRIVNDPSYEVASTITFSCNSGYDLVGQSTLTCRTDGQWNLRPPTCIAKDCGAFGVIANGNVFVITGPNGDNRYGSRARITCDEFFVLQGNRYVDCGADGTWGLRPTCVQVTCPSYPGLNTSCIYNSLYVANTGTLYISCDDNANNSVTKQGPDSVECNNNQWNDLSSACFCDCRQPKHLTFRTKNTKGFLPHSQVTTFTCNTGFEKIISDDLRCNDGILILQSSGQALPRHSAEMSLCRARTTTDSASTRKSITTRKHSKAARNDSYSQTPFTVIATLFVLMFTLF